MLNRIRMLVSLGFQFHKGTIRTIRILDVIVTLNIFQFHKGTIRTISSASSPKSRQKFQFHKGTIRTIVEAGEGGKVTNFNSINVRLEPLVKFLGKTVYAISIP